MPPQIHTQRKSPQKFNVPSWNGWLWRYILDMPRSVCQSTSLNSPPVNNGWNVAGSFIDRGLKKPTTVTDFVPFESCACLADMWNKRRKMKKLCPCPTVESRCMYQQVESFQPCFRPVKTLLFCRWKYPTSNDNRCIHINFHHRTSYYTIGSAVLHGNFQSDFMVPSQPRFPRKLIVQNTFHQIIFGRKPLNPTATKPKND